MLESSRVPGNNPVNAHIATVPNDSLSASAGLLFHIKWTGHSPSSECQLIVESNDRMWLYEPFHPGSSQKPFANVYRGRFSKGILHVPALQVGEQTCTGHMQQEWPHLLGHQLPLLWRKTCFHLPFHPSWHRCGLMPQHHFGRAPGRESLSMFPHSVKNSIPNGETLSHLLQHISPATLASKLTVNRFLQFMLALYKTVSWGQGPGPISEGTAAGFGRVRMSGQPLLQAGDVTYSTVPALTESCPHPV